MAASTIAVNLSGVTGNVYAQAGMNTVYTNVPQNDTVNILVGSEVAAIQLTNPYYTNDTTTGFHVLQNIEVQDSYANYKVWSYYGNVILTNKLTGQVIQFQLTKPLPGANNSGVNVEFLDGALAYTANVSANGNWTTWITKGDTGTSTWGTNSVATPFTAATALDQTLLGPSGTNTVNQAVNSSDVNDWYGIEPSWFSSEYYLFSKQAELAAQGVTITIPELEAAITEAGFTPYTHYLAFSTEELTDPNEYFSTLQVLEAQAAVTGLTVAEVQAEFEAAGFTNAYDWWAQYGWTNGINPSNDFNDEAYLEAKAMASGLTIAEVQQAFIDAGLTPLAHYLEFGQAEGLEATPVYLDEQVAWQYSQALGATAGQAVVGSEVSEQFTAVASPLSRLNTLHATDTINGQGGINTLTVDLAQNFAGFSAGKGLTNIQNVQLINGDANVARTYNGTGSTGVENYALAGEVNLASLSSIANVVAQDREGALTIGYAAKVTDGKADQLNLTTIDVGTKDSVVTVTAAGIETLQLDTHGVNILNLSGVDSATELVILGDGVTEIEAVGAAVTAVDAAYASGDLTVNLSGATGVTSVVTGTGENHIQADLTANSGQLAKNAVITGNGTLYDELLLTNVTGSGTTTVQYTMTGVEGLAFGNINGSTVQYSAKNTTGLEHVEIQSAFTSGSFVNVVNLGAVDIDVQLQGTSGGMVTIDNLGATLVTTEASTAAISTATAETNNTAVTLNNATVLDVYVDAFTALGGSITANKAAVVDIEIDGAVSNVITAAAATGVTVLQNNKTVSSTLDLVAAAATSLEVISAGTLTLSSGFTDLGNLQTLNVDTAQSFTLYKDIAAANSVTLSGAGDVTLMNVGATTNGYSLTVDASDLDGDLTTGNLAVGTGQNINLNLSTLGGTAMIGSGFSDALTATTGAVAIDASEAMGAIEVGNILAKNVTVDAGGSLGSFQSGLISASSSVTYVGTELFANSVDIQATGTSLTVALTGGLGNDNIEVDGGVATSKITLTGDLGSGDNVLTLDALSSATVGIHMNYAALYNYDTAAVTGSSLADTITAGSGNDTITGGAAADNLSGGNGDNVFQYGNGEFIAAETVTGGTGTDTVLFTADAQTVADSAFTNKTLIEAITTANGTNSITLGVNAAAATSNLTVTGGSGADRVDASAMTKALTIIGNAGNDTLIGGAGNDTIAAGIDLDSITAGAGADLVTLTVDGATDSITQGVADGVASTANTLTAGQAIAAGQSMTFGNGLDVITHFLAGAGGDVLTVDFNTAQSILGQTSSNIGVSGYLSGTYANGAFTVAANGAGPDTLIVQVGGGANLANNSNTSMLLLLGVDSAQLADANFGGIVNLTATFAGSVYSIIGAASGQLTMNAATGVLNEAANYPLPHFNQATVTSIDFSAVTGGHGAIINVQGATSSVLASVVGTSASDFIIQATEDMGAAQNTVDGGGGTDALQFLSVGANVSLTQTAGGGNVIASIEQVRLTAGSTGTVTLDDSITSVVEVYNDSGTDAATVVLGSGAAHSYTNGSGNAINDVTLRGTGQSVSTADGSDTISIGVAGSYTGTLALAGGANTVALGNGVNLAQATTTALGGTWAINLADGAGVTLRTNNLMGANAASGINGGVGAGTESVAVDTSQDGALQGYTLDTTVVDWEIGVVGNGANNITLGSTSQNVAFGSGNDVLNTINGITGAINLGAGANVVSIGNAQNIQTAAVTAGGGSYTLNLLDGNNAFSATVSAAQLTGALGVSTQGTGATSITADNAAVTGYTVDADIDTLTMGNFANSVTLLANSAQTINGGNAVDTVTAATGITGMLELGAGANVVNADGSSNIAGATITAAGGSWVLNLGNASTVTVGSQHLQSIAGSTAASGITGSPSWLVVDTAAGGLVNYTLDTDVGLYEIGLVGQTQSNSVIFGATFQNAFFSDGNDTVTLLNNATNNVQMNGGANVVRVLDGLNISGANLGATGGSYGLRLQNDGGTLFDATVSADQLTGAAGGVSVAGGDTVWLTLSNQIQNYNIDSDINRLILANANNVVTLGAGAQDVTMNGGTATINTGAQTILTGVLNGALSTVATLNVQTDANIAGLSMGDWGAGDAITLESGVDVTARIFQNALITTAAGANIVTLSDTGSATGAAQVESYVLASGVNTFTLGAAGQNVTGSAGADTVVGAALVLTGVLNGGGGGNTLSLGGGVLGTASISNFQTLLLTDSENIASANGGLALGTTTLQMSDNDILTMTVAQNQGLSGSAAVAGTGQQVTLTDAGSSTGIAGIETYNLGGGTNTFTFSTTTTQSAIGNNGVDTFVMGGNATAFGANQADTYHVVSGTNNVINGLGYGGGQSDVVMVDAGATASTSAINESWTAGTGTYNNGTVSISNNSGYAIDVSVATGSAGWSINNVGNITGSAQSDILVGVGVASQMIIGGDGNDTITGGAKADTMNGGVGADTFVYTGSQTQGAAETGDVTTGIVDLITGFTTNSDKIDFSVAGSLSNFSANTEGVATYSQARAEADDLFTSLVDQVYSVEAYGAGTSWTSVLFINANGSGGSDGAIIIGSVGSFTTSAAALSAIVAADIV